MIGAAPAPFASPPRGRLAPPPWPPAARPASAVASTPPDAEWPAPAVASTPPDAEWPAPAVASTPPDAEWPAPAVASTPPDAEWPAPAVASTPAVELVWPPTDRLPAAASPDPATFQAPLAPPML